jgi:hypothetical protein
VRFLEPSWLGDFGGGDWDSVSSTVDTKSPTNVQVVLSLYSNSQQVSTPKSFELTVALAPRIKLSMLAVKRYYGTAHTPATKKQVDPHAAKGRAAGALSGEGHHHA